MDPVSALLLFICGLSAAINAAFLAFYAINRFVLARTGANLPAIERWPEVAVCIPARDEELNVGRCVESFLKQDYPGKFTVNVLDDESQDATPQILTRLAATDPRVRIFNGSGEPLPPKWVGKVWANTRLGRLTSSEFMLFVDADTCFDAHMLRECISRALKPGNENVGLFSGYLRFEQESFWEAALMPAFSTSQHMLPLPLALKRAAGGPAPGHWHMFRREIYEKIGGYAKVWDKVLDDMETSSLVNRSGYRTYLFPLERVGSVRMYRTFSEIWWGFHKSIGYTLQWSWLNALGLILIMLVSGVLPFFAPLFGLWRGWLAPETLLCFGSLAAILLWRWLIQRDHTGPWWGFLTHPLMAVFLGLNGLHGVLSLKLGYGVVWKGRRYDATQARAAQPGAATQPK